MFDWGVLKRGVPESVRFCIGNLPMYTFLVPTHPYLKYKILKRKRLILVKYINIFIYLKKKNRIL